MANLVDFNTCAMNDIHLQQRTACWKCMTSAHRTQFFYQVNCYYCCTAYMLIRSVMTHTQIRIISLSLSLSLSLSYSTVLLLWFERILFFLLRFYKLDNTNSNVNVRNTACSIEHKNFYQHTVTRVARDRTRTMIIISALYCTIAVDFPMFPNLALSCSIWSISHQRRCIS